MTTPGPTNPRSPKTTPAAAPNPSHAGKPGRRIKEFQTTPNPNALKCVLDAPLDGASSIRSFRSAAEAAGDPIGEPLFRIKGITSVLIAPGGAWVTVNKDADTTWESVKPAVRAALG